jgi:uncharacterized Rmd1/YagE family protein
MRTIFPKNHQNSAGSARIELKIIVFFEFKFKKFEKKIKKSGKIMLKIDQILRTLGEIFFKSRPFCKIKFKLNQKYKNGPT